MSPKIDKKLQLGITLILLAVISWNIAKIFSVESLQARSVVPQELKGQLNPPGRPGPIQVPDYPTLKQGTPITDRTWIELNKIVNPAIVHISTSTLIKPRMMDPFSDQQMPFGRPFGMPPGGRPKSARSLGSGFIIGEEGLVVTNNHVVEGADAITVELPDSPGQQFEATIVGRDQRSDVALLQIDGKGRKKFPVLQLGSSKDLEVGEHVAAFGSPLGLSKSMTTGIISGKDRPIDEINKFPFLQTDALINPGNSGGPLVNTKALVIGMNTAINAAGQGIGFAIPIDEVKYVISQLQHFGAVKRGYLGLVPQDISPQGAAYLGLKSLEGALVTFVEPKSPADKAGLKELDVIVKFGNKDIRTAMDLRHAAGDSEIGVEVPVKVIREGKERPLKVTIAEAPLDPRTVPPPAQPLRPPSKNDKQGFGLSFSALTPELRKVLRIDDPKVSGVVISEVVPNSTAAFAGLEPEDVILQINGDRVNTPDEAIAKMRKSSNALMIWRRGIVLSIFIGAGE